MACGNNCGNDRSGRSDQRCPDCQNKQRRLTKRHNNYQPHGVCQTVASRAYLRSKATKPEA